MSFRTFSELVHIPTFEARYEYLALDGHVGSSTFGFDRWMNQQLYRSVEWRRIRNFVIARDNGCDLAMPGFEIHDRIYIHHMNPMRAYDIVHDNEDIFNIDYLISTTHRTHNAIHYGTAELLPRQYVPRSAGDTKLW
jgi:hypothetical protein